jgi:hypothetical protein
MSSASVPQDLGFDSHNAAQILSHNEGETKRETGPGNTLSETVQPELKPRRLWLILGSLWVRSPTLRATFYC